MYTTTSSKDTSAVSAKKNSNNKKRSGFRNTNSGVTSPSISYKLKPSQNYTSHSTQLCGLIPNSSIQTKLKIGQPNDSFEQEADQTAEKVMTSSLPTINTLQRQKQEDEEVQTKPIIQKQGEEEEEVQTKSLIQKQGEEEEEVQAKPMIQKQGEEEEEVQAKPMIQKQGDEEEEVQSKPMIQKQGEEEEEVQAKPLVSQITPRVLQGKLTSSQTLAQRQGNVGEAANRTGMPGPLNAGLEALSGMDLSGIRVHTNSSKPAQLNALAYTQGQDIHVGPGQEKHLPHEGWHVVQQMQGRVKPTIQAKGVSINDDAGLEREADVMSVKALQKKGEEQATRASNHWVGTSLQKAADGAKTAFHPSSVSLSGDRKTQSSPAHIQRKTKGEKTFDKSQKHLTLDADIKKNVDKIKAALKEIRNGQSTSYNENAGLKLIDALGVLLVFGVKKIAKLKKDWKWIIKNRKAMDYKNRKKFFFRSFISPINALSKKYPKSHAKYFLRNTPANVFDVIHDVSDAIISAEAIYAFAANEGLIDVYIRPQTGVGTGNPTAAQLGKVKTTKSVSGFDALGLDDFMTDMKARNEPLTKFKPAGFDISKLTPISEVNELGRTVHSAKFPNLKMAMQGLVMMMKRRLALFLKDAKTFGYGTASTEIKVYFMYLYFNPGESAGKKTLRVNKGKRKLVDWPKTKFFASAKKVLDHYRMIRALKIF